MTKEDVECHIEDKKAWEELDASLWQEVKVSASL